MTINRTITITLTEDDLFDAALQLGDDREAYRDSFLKDGNSYGQGVMEFITVLLGKDVVRDREQVLNDFLNRA